MVIVIIGPNQSGKSLLAEKIFSQLKGPKLYIATLPPLMVNKGRIWRHKKRRPPEWDVVELIGDLDYDSGQLKNLPINNKDVLVDGLSIYIDRVLPAPIFSTLLWSKQILNWLHVNIVSIARRLIIVDCLPNDNTPNDLNEYIKEIHSGLFQIADIVYGVDRGGVVSKKYQNTKIQQEEFI